MGARSLNGTRPFKWVVPRSFGGKFSTVRPTCVSKSQHDYGDIMTFVGKQILDSISCGIRAIFLNPALNVHHPS